MTTTPQPFPDETAETVDPWLDAPREQGAEFSVFDVLVALARQRRVILRTTLLFFVVALLYGILSPRVYESTVTILPPAQMSTRGVGGSIQDLSTALSAAEGFTFKSAEDFWTAVLKGPTVSDRIIQKEDLMRVYHVKLKSKAEKELERHTIFDIDKAGLISITVKDRDPKRAADIATAYIESMHQSMSDMAEDDAAQRKVFFDAQVEQERKNMAAAEQAMMDVERRTGVIALGGQTEEAIRQIADLRARITSKKVDLESMRTIATDANPEVQRLKSEIAADENALEKAQTENGRTKVGDIDASDVPQATLDYIGAARELRYHESLYEAMGKQVEAARMDAARSAPLIQVVDPAKPADHPTGTSAVLIVLLGTVFGLVAGILLGASRHFYSSLKSNPEGSQKLHELAAAVRGDDRGNEAEGRA